MADLFEQFRFIKSHNLSSADGLARDEALILSLEKKLAPPALHLYNFKPSVIVGRFQNLQSSIRIEKCDELGIEINRRCSGGGTVFMTPDQMALGFVLPNDYPGLPKTIRGLFEFLAEPLADALSGLGIASQFEGKNDLQVDGKKIAGLAISQDSQNVTFFHVSLLLDFDLRTMLEILNLPTQKFLDRGISCFGERMTTIRRELADSVPPEPNTPRQTRPSLISIEQIISLTRSSFEKYLKIPFADLTWTNDENMLIDELKTKRYLNEEWIYSTRAPKKKHVYVSKRTAGGLLQAHITFSGKFIETALFTGDYFSRSKDVAKMESALKWSAVKEDSLRKALHDLNDKSILYQINEDDIISLLIDALKEHEKELK